MALYRSYGNVTVSRSRSSSVDRSTGFRREQTPSIFPLGRSSSQVFSSGRSAPPASWERRTPYSSSPYYSDRYPHVRHSHGYEADATAIKIISTLPGYSRTTRASSYNSPGSWHYGVGRSSTVADMYSSRHGSSRYSPYSSTSYSSPYSSPTPAYERTSSRSRFGSSNLKLDDAVGLYSKRYMTVGALSRYWLDGSSSSSSRHSSSSYTPSPSYTSSYSVRNTYSTYGQSSSPYSSGGRTSYLSGSGYNSMRYGGSSYRTYR